jgi:anti-sigma-K factor RskA
VPVGPAADEPTAASRIHERKLRHAELENSQKLWRWFILAALGIVGVEILLAGILAGGAKTAEATT